MKTIVTYSSKGGTTKTTSIANLGGWLAEHGFKVLMVDADHTQPSLSSYYPLKHKACCGLTELIKSRQITRDMICHTTYPQLDMIYSNDSQNELSAFLRDVSDGLFRIKIAIQVACEKGILDYDVILIDTRGATGIISDAAIVASDVILSPVPPDVLSAGEFSRGTISRYQDIASGLSYLNHRLAPVFTYLTRVEKTSDAKNIADAMVSVTRPLTDFYFLNKVQIPHSTAYKAAASAQMPVHTYDTKTYASIPNGRQVMENLWLEICNQHNALNPDQPLKKIQPRKGERP